MKNQTILHPVYTVFQNPKELQSISAQQKTKARLELLRVLNPKHTVVPRLHFPVPEITVGPIILHLTVGHT